MTALWPPPREMWPTCSGCGVQIARPDLEDGQHSDDCPRARRGWATTTGAALIGDAVDRAIEGGAPVVAEIPQGNSTIQQPNRENGEGSSTSMATTKAKTPTKSRGHNLQRSSTKTATPAKSAPKPKPTELTDDVLDTRALPFVISWVSDDGSFKGQSATGDWGNARYRIKGHLDKAHTSADVRAGLTAALEAVRVGRDFKIHDVQITCAPRS